MKRPRSRLRRLVVTDELLAAFRAALSYEMVRGRKALTDEGHAAIQALMLVGRTRPCERPLTDPLGGGPLQDALLARLTKDEMKAWQRYASRCRREHAAFVAEYEAASKWAAGRLNRSLAP
jgi:hypothetical protein